jgi:hypothetical protein
MWVDATNDLETAKFKIRADTIDIIGIETQAKGKSGRKIEYFRYFIGVRGTYFNINKASYDWLMDNLD